MSENLLIYKAMRTLEKIVNINFFGTLNINKYVDFTELV